MKGKNKNIVILGAGLAGLACGYELTKAGYTVTIIDKEPEVGGLARTIEINGFRFDTGPHRWYTKNDMVNNWMLKLMGDEVIKVPRLTRIYFDKKFFNYPVQIKSTLDGLGFWKTTLAVADFLLQKIKQLINKKEAVTIEEGYINQFGKTLYELFFKRYTEKLWGTSCKNISADWLGQRSRGFNVTTIIKNTIFPKDKIVSFVDEFSYPDLGIGRIAQKLADSLIRGGGNIILNANISYIENSNYSIDTIIYKQKIATKSLKADAVVSTIPLSKLISCLKPAVPKEILKVNRKLTYRDEVQVVLFVNKTKVTPDTWVYVHPFEIPFVRFMEMDNWSTKLSPHGTTAIVFELVCNKDDSVWRKSDRELIEWITGIFIDEFGFIYKKDIKSSYVHRVEGEYPVYHIGYQNDLVVLKSYLNKFTNLQIAGRNGTFRYNNMDHSIEMGLYAAWNIIDGENKFDINSVNIEREYLEEKKIKDGAEFIEDQKVE